MLRIPRGARDPDRFWVDTVLPYLESIGCDGRIGRHTPPFWSRAATPIWRWTR